MKVQICINDLAQMRANNFYPHLYTHTEENEKISDSRMKYIGGVDTWAKLSS